MKMPVKTMAENACKYDFKNVCKMLFKMPAKFP
jgi:hypothetical protein